ncbi:class I SAM-dependent RNA methyltransferase [Ruminococcus sp.]|uniref:THUMP domain-containing class I SAM-dependent RNA methyltransferase n=1 Tax=Ruminococcus sp. TaxID=41978 RepID=UPI003869359E
MQFVAPCLLGLEGLAANDLKFKGISDVRAENGKVLFSGDESTLVRANLCLSLCARVFILMAEFDARDFDTLFEGVKAADWSRYIGERDAFPVKGSSLSSELNSIPACQKIIKKAVVEKLKERYHTSWFEEDGGVHQIQFRIFKNRVSVYLDTTGAALNKRGYRVLSNDAPMKETLAAAMVELARVRKDHIVVDPFCGSGTIVIEAARKALNIMPGVDREFAFEAWSQIDPAVIESERQRAREEERDDAAFMGYGYDIDDASLELARHNAELGRVSHRVRFEKRDFRDYTDSFERVSVITNPPYGERLLDIEQARDLYRAMGEKFSQKPFHSYTIISPDERFEQLFGRAADKRRKLYNGTLKCQVYQYYK